MPATPQTGKIRRAIDSVCPGIGATAVRCASPAGPCALPGIRPGPETPFVLQDRQNLARLRKSVLFVLRKQQLAVERDVEHAAPAPLEFDLQTRVDVQFRLQTGGARQVISAAAVLDDYSGNDFHLRVWAVVRRGLLLRVVSRGV